jgi:excisionase family DNA binding protein
MTTKEQFTRGLLTLNQFAELTGWKPSTVRQKVWRRQIDFVRMGRSIRFRPETLEQLIAEGIVLAEKQG